MAARGFDPHDTVSIETLGPDGAKQVFELKTSGIAYARTFVVASVQVNLELASGSGGVLLISF